MSATPSVRAYPYLDRNTVIAWLWFRNVTPWSHARDPQPLWYHSLQANDIRSQ